MCQFLEERGREDKKKWRPVKRYILGTAQETEVCEEKLYICDILLRKCGIEAKAVILEFKEDCEYYYTIQSDSL